MNEVQFNFNSISIGAFNSHSSENETLISTNKTQSTVTNGFLCNVPNALYNCDECRQIEEKNRCENSPVGSVVHVGHVIDVFRLLKINLP